MVTTDSYKVGYWPIPEWQPQDDQEQKRMFGGRESNGMVRPRICENSGDLSAVPILIETSPFSSTRIARMTKHYSAGPVTQARSNAVVHPASATFGRASGLLRFANHGNLGCGLAVDFCIPHRSIVRSRSGSNV
jgi:hypothetical protein